MIPRNVCLLYSIYSLLHFLHFFVLLMIFRFLWLFSLLIFFIAFLDLQLLLLLSLPFFVVQSFLLNMALASRSVLDSAEAELIQPERPIPKYERNVEPRATLQTLLDQGSKWKFYNKSAVSLILFSNTFCQTHTRRLFINIYLFIANIFEAYWIMDPIIVWWFKLAFCVCPFRYWIFRVCWKDSLWKYRLLFPITFHNTFWAVSIELINFKVFISFFMLELFRSFRSMWHQITTLSFTLMGCKLILILLVGIKQHIGTGISFYHKNYT